MLDLTTVNDPTCSGDSGHADLYPYIVELLEDAPQVLLDYVTSDLAAYEATGYFSLTLARLLERARCLADVDLISAKFAA